MVYPYTLYFSAKFGNSTTLNVLNRMETYNGYRKLLRLDEELDKLQINYDVALEQGIDDPHRLKKSHFKLRDVIRKNSHWRKELLEQLKQLK
jgi:hypothetical protein